MCADRIVLTLVERIRDKDNIVAEQLLQKVPVYAFNPDQQNDLLLMMLNTAAEVNNFAIVPIIMAIWAQVYPSGDRCPFISTLYADPLFDVPLLYFMTEAMTKYDTEGGPLTFLQIIDDLTGLGTTDQVGMGCLKAESVFGPQPEQTLRIVLENALMQENEVVFRYAEGRLAEISEYAPIPVWVRDFETQHTEQGPVLPGIEDPDKNRLPRTSELKPVVIIPHPYTGTRTEFIDYMTKKQEGASSYRDDLVNVIDAMDERTFRAFSEKTLYLEALMASQYDTTYFRLLGPCHPFLYSTEEQLKWGGSRMFLCRDFDHDDDNDVYLDWFNGHCRVCLRRIRRRWHAVRKPLPYGGWSGCYCSIKCIMDDDNEEQPQVYILASYFEKLLLADGIQDRMDDSPYIEEDSIEPLLIDTIRRFGTNTQKKALKDELTRKASEIVVISTTDNEATPSIPKTKARAKIKSVSKSHKVKP